MNKGFAQIGYRHDHANQTIVLTKKFSKSSSIVGSKDYKWMEACYTGAKAAEVPRASLRFEFVKPTLENKLSGGNVTWQS